MKTYYNIKSIPWDLLLKVLKSEGDEDEYSRLNAWIDANSEHRRLWNELRQSWDDIGAFNAGFNPDSLHAWQKIVEKTEKRYVKPTRIIPMFWRTVAACVLVLLGVAAGILFETTAPVSYTKYETQYGKSLLTLPDGTQVWLNSRSTLSVSNSFNDKERCVEMQGEALFNVAHNPNIPFVVHTAQMKLMVHGTRFNVMAYGDTPQTSVSLIEGSLSITAGDYPYTRLEPGYTAIFDSNDNNMTLNPSDEFATVWASKELRIEDKSLEETAKMLEKWYGIRFDVAPTLKNSHYYNLTVRDESVAELLNVMRKIGKFRYKINEHTITIY